MGAEAPFLVAHRLTRAYGATLTLDHVDLAVAEGNVLAVLGPNGCGRVHPVTCAVDALRALRAGGPAAGPPVPAWIGPGR